MKILIAVPTFENIYPDTFKSIYDLNPVGNELVFEFVRGYDCAAARNEIVSRAQLHKADYVLMVDNDMILPQNLLAHMLEDARDVTIACCPCRHFGEQQTVDISAYKLGEFNYNTRYTSDEIKNELQNGVTKLHVHGGGMACALINMSVFERIDKPWFYWVIYGDGSVLSEDLHFCEQCRKKGIDIYLDTRAQCGHIFRYPQWP